MESLSLSLITYLADFHRHGKFSEVVDQRFPSAVILQHELHASLMHVLDVCLKRNDQ